jgi:hypothetical protein
VVALRIGVCRFVQRIGNVTQSRLPRSLHLEAQVTRSAFPWFESYQAASASL